MASPRLLPPGWTPSAPPAMPWTPEHYSSAIILRVENEFRIIQRPPTYTLSTSFDNIWPEGVSDFPPVTSDTWHVICPNVSILFAEALAEPEPHRSAPRPNTRQLVKALRSTPIASAPRPFRLKVFRKGQPIPFTLSVSSDTLVSRLYELVAAHESVEEDSVDLLLGQRRLDRQGNQTLGAAGVNSRVTVVIKYSRSPSWPRKRKPVIYLFPPFPLRASITLSLSPSWVFDAVYPTTEIRQNLEANGYPQTIQWEVDAKPNGDLLEQATDLQVSYLFWEARANRPITVQERPPTSFHPNLSTCTPFNSVVLEHADLLKYLDTSLKALGLHIEARTSFITYWIPDFQKHSFIALRFVPQSAFEIAAPLVIEPKPDVVTRVFMLFKGLPDLQDGQWTQAVERADEDVTRWKDIVGVDSDKQANRSLFRVLEWGGMEVYS